MSTNAAVSSTENAIPAMAAARGVLIIGRVSARGCVSFRPSVMGLLRARQRRGLDRWLLHSMLEISGHSRDGLMALTL
jgi:hypothetical protein